MSRSAKTAAAAASSAAAAAAASATAMAAACRDDVRDDATCMYLFGRNEHGELNRGHKQNLLRPVVVAPPNTLAAWAFGHEHSVALMITHEIFSCGSWVAGKQADAEVTSHVTRLRKIRAAELQSASCIKVACGESHSVALTSDGELYSWGGTRHGKLGRAAPVAAAAPSSSSSSTTFSAFGSSVAGRAAQQALADAAAAAAASEKPVSFRVPGAVFRNQKVTQISCGRLHTVVSTSDGGVFAFGSNECGQLGVPACKEGSDTPRAVVGGAFAAAGGGASGADASTAGVRIVNVMCGAFFTFALSEAREVYAWGDGSFGQLGRGDRYDWGIFFRECEPHFQGVSPPTYVTVIIFYDNQLRHAPRTGQDRRRESARRCARSGVW